MVQTRKAGPRRRTALRGSGGSPSCFHVVVAPAFGFSKRIVAPETVAAEEPKEGWQPNRRPRPQAQASARHDLGDPVVLELVVEHGPGDRELVRDPVGFLERRPFLREPVPEGR